MESDFHRHRRTEDEIILCQCFTCNERSSRVSELEVLLVSSPESVGESIAEMNISSLSPSILSMTGSWSGKVSVILV